MEPTGDADHFDLSRDRFGRLVLAVGGQTHAGVAPVRAFPLSAAEEGIALVGSDGRELAWIDRADRLSPAARALLEAELEQRDFRPVIGRLISVSTYSTPSVWRVATDRGPTDFVLAGEEDIRRLPNDALLITSRHGLGFLVRDRWALDAASRRLLERFL